MGSVLLAYFTRAVVSLAFYYPLFMAYLWMIGAINYYFRFERASISLRLPPESPDQPVTLIIPMHNEAENAAETVRYALSMDYPEFEVIAVNDGSTDGTARILDELAQTHERLRVVHLEKNQGKALALQAGALVARHEYLICIDGDAVIDPHAARWMVRHFRSPRVGAITGNPRIRTRSTLLGKVQVGEFSAIVGLIKRAQRTYGRLFTVSGVIAAFRKSALHDVGYWSADIVTEDIDITWKMEIRHWDIRYEPHALVWILMPETLSGLWKQRLRWAVGGVQVAHKFARDLGKWRSRRMWGILAEYLLSVSWAYSIALTATLWLLGLVVSLPSGLRVASPIPGWTGVIIGTTCLLQIGLSLLFDRRYDYGLVRIYFYMIWFPLVFWVISALATIVAVPRALGRRRLMRATWVSPDRGVTHEP